MFEKGKAKGTIRFSIQADVRVRRVLLAGDFDGWQPVAMRRQKGGRFVAVVPVPPGTHQYKFIVDGRWTTDPDNQRQVLNRFGTPNSVAVVG